MALSEKRKGKIKVKAEEANELVEYLEINVEERNTHWNTFLLYLSSENLVKHSKALTWLTLGLFATALGMIGLAIAQLVVITS